MIQQLDRTKNNTASFAEIDRQARAGNPVSVVYLGGSLTWGANASDPNRTSWRARTGDWLRRRYPTAPFEFHDAAIGGSGSDLAMFRLERDVLAWQPAMVFLEFTINDHPGGSDVERLACYEEILRTLIGHGIAVVQVILGDMWCFGPERTPDMLPRRLAHLRLAEAYQTVAVDTIASFHQLLESGQWTPEEIWEFGNVHPGDRGYELCRDLICATLEKALDNGLECRLPEHAVYPRLFARRERRRLVDRPLPDGWSRATTYRTAMWYDGLSSRWMGDVAMCASADRDRIAPLRFDVEGRMVGLFGEADEHGLSFRVLLDGELLRNPDHAPDGIWGANTSRFGSGRLFFWRCLTRELSPGPHSLEIHPIFGDGMGQLRIESICIAGPDSRDGEASWAGQHA